MDILAFIGVIFVLYRAVLFLGDEVERADREKSVLMTQKLQRKNEDQQIEKKKELEEARIKAEEAEIQAKKDRGEYILNQDELFWGDRFRKFCSWYFFRSFEKHESHVYMMYAIQALKAENGFTPDVRPNLYFSTDEFCQLCQLFLPPEIGNWKIIQNDDVDIITDRECKKYIVSKLGHEPGCMEVVVMEADYDGLFSRGDFDG